jgi:hypothetical protein
MSAALEIFLARLYGNALEAESFLRQRAAYARAAGLPEEHLPDVLAIDAGALRFAAQSFERKRRDRVGGELALTALPHHRTCGSASGGST